MSPQPRYRGEYPRDWPEVAERAKRAAGYRCVRCGHAFYMPHRDVPAGEIGARAARTPMACDDECDVSRGHPFGVLALGEGPTPRGLSYGVHHLDGDKSNCRWWNLLPMCNSCHLGVQAKVDPETPYLWEHSTWFKPYVAGFYAFYYGGVELPDLRAADDPAESIDFYLSLGQPWLYPPPAPPPPPEAPNGD